MVGGGSPDRGKCTIEVVVDGIAEVEIRGDQGFLRTIAGRPAEWRRFQCSDPLPRSPAEFRFIGIDGRGRQNLVRDPRDGGVAVVEVSDTGPGVSEKARAHLFQAFQGSTRAGGTGLGLAIAAELVRAHGGDIRLVPGTIGATFSIRIPDRAVDLSSRRGERARESAAQRAGRGVHRGLRRLPRVRGSCAGPGKT